MVIYMNSNISVTPLVCNMGVFTPGERENHIQSTTRLYRSVQDIHEVENGHGFIFPNQTGIIQNWENLFQTSGDAVHSWGLR